MPIRQPKSLRRKSARQPCGRESRTLSGSASRYGEAGQLLSLIGRSSKYLSFVVLLPLLSVGAFSKRRRSHEAVHTCPVNRSKLLNRALVHLGMDKEETTPIRCAHCHRQLDLGVDTVIFDNGVIGPRGFVPLGKRKFFCDEDCLEHFVSDEDVVRLPRRIP